MSAKPSSAQPMIPVAITQRVSIIESYGERRDALDQQWAHLFAAAGLLPVLVPNVPAIADALVRRVRPAGILLSGGNTLAAYGGDAPERDETERGLMEWALAEGIPVLGVCRGMQVIQHAFDVPLERVEGHVTREQTITVTDASGERRRTVNSFHDFGTTRTAPELEVIARSDDGLVKAIRHRSLPLAGYMWHPERMSPFADEDLQHLREFFG